MYSLPPGPALGVEALHQRGRARQPEALRLEGPREAHRGNHVSFSSSFIIIGAIAVDSFGGGR